MKVGFDIGDISQASRIFGNCKTEMDTIQQELKSSYAQLRSSDWRGQASDRMDQIVGDDWCSEVVRYCDLMKQLTLIMDDVTASYQALYDEAKTLRLVL